MKEQIDILVSSEHLYNHLELIDFCDEKIIEVSVSKDKMIIETNKGRKISISVHPNKEKSNIRQVFCKWHKLKKILMFIEEQPILLRISEDSLLIQINV